MQVGAANLAAFDVTHSITCVIYDLDMSPSSVPFSPSPPLPSAISTSARDSPESSRKSLHPSAPPSPQTPTRNTLPFHTLPSRSPRRPGQTYFTDEAPASDLKAKFDEVVELATKCGDEGPLLEFVRGLVKESSSSPPTKLALPKFVVDALPSAGSVLALEELSRKVPWVRQHYRSQPQLLVPLAPAFSSSQAPLFFVSRVVSEAEGDEDGLVNGACFTPFVDELQRHLESDDSDAAAAAASVLATTDPRLSLYQLKCAIDAPADHRTVDRLIQSFDVALSTMVALVSLAKAKARKSHETDERFGVIRLIASLAAKPYFLAASRAELLFVEDVVPWVEECDLAVSICDIFRKLKKVR